MKARSLALFIPVFCFAIFQASLHAATVLEFTFDSQMAGSGGTDYYYGDASGSGKVARLHISGSSITVSNDNPFSATHPELNGIDESGYYNNSSNTMAGSVGILTDGAFTADASGINLQAGGNKFTMEGWVKPVAFNSQYSTVLWQLSSTHGSYFLGYTTDGSVYVRFQSIDAGQNYTLTLSDYKVPLNQWTHLAYVYNGNSMIIYLNGQSISTTSIGLALPSSFDSISILTQGTFRGYFDDFRLSNVALDPSQLGYYSPFTVVPEPSAAGLIFVTVGVASLFGARKRKPSTH